MRITQIYLIDKHDRYDLSVTSAGRRLSVRPRSAARSPACRSGVTDGLALPRVPHGAKRTERRGHGDGEALRVIDADRAQRFERIAVLDRLGDRLFPHVMADAVDRLDHRMVDRVLEHVLDEAAVDLEVIDRKMLEVRERRDADAEIVQREPTAEPAQRPHEFGGLRQ